jgi:hypothetical protein
MPRQKKTDIIQTMHDISLDDRIKLCLTYKSLDYKWIIRNYLTNCLSTIRQTLKKNDPRIDNSYTRQSGITCGETAKTPQTLFKLANSTFDYFAKYKKSFASDPSLSAITEMCNNPELEFNVLKQDDRLFFLSRVFNQMAGSTRGLYKCYDCGTNARAMFIQLIEKHRHGAAQGLFLTLAEQTRLREEYAVNPDEDPVVTVNKAWTTLRNSPSSCVMILSLGLDNFGHVWIIEKINSAKVTRYHQYQSCFRSHMVLDYVEFKNYGEHPEQSLDIDDFFEKLAYLFGYTGAWTNKEYAIFSELFAFLPVYPIAEGRPSFSFTSVIY